MRLQVLRPSIRSMSRGRITQSILPIPLFRSPARTRSISCLFTMPMRSRPAISARSRPCNRPSAGCTRAAWERSIQRNKTDTMMRNFFLIATLTAAAFGLANPTFAQYPTIPDDVKAQSEAMLKEAYRRSDSAWQVAWPTVDNEAKHGKPYVPWAGRPTDLPQSTLLAFPGAQGRGAHSFGGHGGKVLVVTSLEDTGPGTLRWACEQGGARIIVFNVAGIIHLHSPIIVRAPYITIEGQSAPGDGICVAGESFWVNTHD